MIECDAEGRVHAGAAARDWSRVLEKALSAPSFERLEAFLGEERRRFTIYPSEEDTFSAFRLTPYEQVRVLVLGQDPYHGPGQAHGLAFSVQPGVPSPPSLVNIFKELQSDLGLAPPGQRLAGAVGAAGGAAAQRGADGARGPAQQPREPGLGGLHGRGHPGGEREA